MTGTTRKAMEFPISVEEFEGELRAQYGADLSDYRSARAWRTAFRVALDETRAACAALGVGGVEELEAEYCAAVGKRALVTVTNAPDETETENNEDEKNEEKEVVLKFSDGEERRVSGERREAAVEAVKRVHGRVVAAWRCGEVKRRNGNIEEELRAWERKSGAEKRAFFGKKENWGLMRDLMFFNRNRNPAFHYPVSVFFEYFPFKKVEEIGDDTDENKKKNGASSLLLVYKKEEKTNNSEKEEEEERFEFFKELYGEYMPRSLYDLNSLWPVVYGTRYFDYLFYEAHEADDFKNYMVDRGLYGFPFERATFEYLERLCANNKRDTIRFYDRALAHIGDTTPTLSRVSKEDYRWMVDRICGGVGLPIKPTDEEIMAFCEAKEHVNIGNYPYYWNMFYGGGKYYSCTKAADVVAKVRRWMLVGGARPGDRKYMVPLRAMMESGGYTFADLVAEVSDGDQNVNMLVRNWLNTAAVLQKT